ncbi:hypothetical protein R6Q59_017495 [Mikania micrantha]
MKLLDPNINKSPPIDNNKPKGGPSNPLMQGGQPGICLPMFCFELSCMPHGYPSPWPIDTEELNDYGVVYYYNNYDNVISSSLGAFGHEPQGDLTSHVVQGGQPVAPVERSLQPLRAPPSRPTYVEGLHDDDKNKDNHEDVDNVDIVISSPLTFDPVELNSDDDDEDAGDDDEEGNYYIYDNNDDKDDDVDADHDEDGGEEEDDDNGDYIEEGLDGHNNEDAAVGVGVDDAIISSSTTFGQAITFHRNQGTPLTDSEQVSAHEQERGPTNPMAQHNQQGIYIPLPLVEQSLQPQGAPTHGPIVVVILDSDDDVDEVDVDDDEVNIDDDDEVITQEMEIIYNHQRNKRRVDSQPQVNIRDFNVHLVGTRSSMAISSRNQENPVTIVELAETSSCNQRRRLVNFEETSSSMLNVEPVAPLPLPPPPPPSPPVPTYTCPICLGPMVEETISTKCGHLFCDRCIRSAISAQARCPVCRRSITHRGLFRVFFPAPI